MTLKGTQRKMIVLKTGESELFEAAYFIIRDTAGKTGDGDMVREAAKIVEGASLGNDAIGKRRRFGGLRSGFSLLSLLAGVLAGALVSSFFWIAASFLF